MKRPLTFYLKHWAGHLSQGVALCHSETLELAADPIPLSLRRRITPAGRNALQAAWTLCPALETSAHYILCSRHGEYDRTFDMLVELTRSGTASPADFSLAVHHALVGLLSIAKSNHQSHTAIGAGEESIGYGLLEAIAMLHETKEPVLLIYVDHPLPDAYASLAVSQNAALSAAFWLLPETTEEVQAVTLTLESTSPETPPSACFAAEVIHFLTSQQPQTLVCGETLNWRFDRAA